MVKEESTRPRISVPFEIISKVSPFYFGINPPFRSDDNLNERLMTGCLFFEPRSKRSLLLLALPFSHFA
jgi:hypothetical protein